MLGFYNVDCMEVLPTLPNDTFDLAIVDPPYGIGIDKKMSQASGKKSGGVLHIKVISLIRVGMMPDQIKHTLMS